MITRTHGEPDSDVKEVVCVEVINLSSFPVTISEIGFGRRKDLRHFMYLPTLTNGKTWPPRLEARESVTAFGSDKAELDPKIVAEAKGLTNEGRLMVPAPQPKPSIWSGKAT